MKKPTKIQQFPPGSVLVLTTGEYSDYTIVGVLVTIKPCDLPYLYDLYRSSYKAEDQWSGKPDPNDFPSWLVANSFAIPVDFSKILLGFDTTEIVEPGYNS